MLSTTFVSALLTARVLSAQPQAKNCLTFGTSVKGRLSQLIPKQFQTWHCSQTLRGLTSDKIFLTQRVETSILRAPGQSRDESMVGTWTSRTCLEAQGVSTGTLVG